MGYFCDNTDFIEHINEEMKKINKRLPILLLQCFKHQNYTWVRGLGHVTDGMVVYGEEVEV